LEDNRLKKLIGRVISHNQNINPQDHIDAFHDGDWHLIIIPEPAYEFLMFDHKGE